MSFFITSVGSGKGADRGGLAGADAQGQKLAAASGAAVVGHHHGIGPLPEKWARSWNFSHQSAGCSQQALVRTGGLGRFYGFATN